MTWFGWLLLIDIVASIAYFIVKNDERKPLTTTDLAIKVLCNVAYVVGILAIGTGKL